MKAMRRAFKVVILARASESGYSCLGFFSNSACFCNVYTGVYTETIN